MELWGTDAWILNMVLRTVIVAVCALSVTHAVVGAAIASYGRVRPWWGVLIGVIGGPLGLLVLLIVSAVRSSDFPASVPRVLRRGEKPPVRIGWIVVLVLLAAVPLAGFVLPALVIRGDWFPTLAITASTPIDVVNSAIVIALFAVAILLSRRRASRWSAVLVSTMAGSWLFSGGIALVFSDIFRGLSEYFVSLDFTVNELLGSLGGWIEGDYVVLPADVDFGYLDFFGFENGRIPLEALNLDQPLGSIELSFGPYIWLSAAAGLVALVWSILEVRAAHRTGLREQAVMRTRNDAATEWPVGGGFGSATAPVPLAPPQNPAG